MSTPASFSELTPGQQQLIDIVGAVYVEHGQWPGWAYIEEEMERLGLDAVAVLASLPTDAHGYWPVQAPGAPAPRPENRVSLSISGLFRVAGADHIVDSFLRLVDAMGRIRAGVRLDPFSETRPTVTRSEILPIAGQFSMDEGRLLEMMKKEPPTWRCLANPTAPDGWTIELAPEIRRFAGVSTAGDYLARLREWTSPPIQVAEPQLVSPFTLPAAIPTSTRSGSCASEERWWYRRASSGRPDLPSPLRVRRRPTAGSVPSPSS